MHSSILSTLAAAGAAGGPPAWIQYLPFAAMAVIMWFLIIRPQMKQQKEHKAKLASITRGNEVVTGGGLVGKVIKVDETYAEVEIAANVRVKVVKSTIVEVMGVKPAND
ncbi:preprotein translocase subunit YajC [Novosphingobium sp. 9]|uniref:preprotein translocase subunit YajC n=1 Tax=Novosphingobium sp. 9 TaxID=2025349 RepID=UPI0021B6BA07|nr:preprotein translocase subunit YajC [Novosphingobium sp. 9]